MSTADAGSIHGVDFSEDEHTVVQSPVRNRCRAEDSGGSVVLRGKQEMLKIIDVTGNYVLMDARTDEEVVFLDNGYSEPQDTWKIRDAETEAKMAEIHSRGAVVTLARNVVPFGGVIPHECEITDQEGNHVGDISGELSLKDKYDSSIDDASDVPKEVIVAAAMVIDAIQEGSDDP